MYRYETHLHTAISSACSRFSPAEIIEKYVCLGYAGVFVTDHYLRGNSSVPHDLPYAERVELFFDGYRQVKRCAAGSGLDVFCGTEISHGGTDFLVYGLEKEWYIANEEIMREPPRELCRRAVNAGALVIQAHPYREAEYIDHIRLFPSEVHGMEVINACRDDRTNRLADVLAREYSLVRFAGSDIHWKTQTKLAGMEFKEKIKSERDFVERVKKGEGSVFTLTDRGVI